MNIYEGIVMATFVMITIIMISQYINDNVPKVIDVLQLMSVLPCYEVKAYRDGKHLKTSELIQQINRRVKAYQMTEGILYIEIY
jgi:hypothetical protein